MYRAVHQKVILAGSGINNIKEFTHIVFILLIAAATQGVGRTGGGQRRAAGGGKGVSAGRLRNLSAPSTSGSDDTPKTTGGVRTFPRIDLDDEVFHYEPRRDLESSRSSTLLLGRIRTQRLPTRLIDPSPETGADPHWRLQTSWSSERRRSRTTRQENGLRLWF